MTGGDGERVRSVNVQRIFGAAVSRRYVVDGNARTDAVGAIGVDGDGFESSRLRSKQPESGGFVAESVRRSSRELHLHRSEREVHRQQHRPPAGTGAEDLRLSETTARWAMALVACRQQHRQSDSRNNRFVLLKISSSKVGVPSVPSGPVYEVNVASSDP